MSFLTEHLSYDHAAVLTGHGGPGVPLIGILDKGVALVDRAAYYLAILGEDGLNICLGDQQGVEVANKHPRVERAGVRLVGDVAA